MLDDHIRNIVVVGGSIAGWLSAATLACALQGQNCVVRVIEPRENPREIGGDCDTLLAQGSLPTLRALHRILGIDEKVFMRATRATFKLGTEFADWSRGGSCYFHPFGEVGARIESVPFHLQWLRVPTRERAPVAEYSLAAVAARLGKFSFPDEDPRSIRSTLDYGYQFDTVLYRAFLREHALRLGVLRVEGNVRDVRLHSENGFIEAVVLEGGERIEGDLFVDASGAHAVLIEGALKTGYENWSHWLPCNRAVTWQQTSVSDTAGRPLPCTRATALPAGWGWEVPLQGYTSAGYVYCDGLLSDEEAAARIPGSRHGVAAREVTRARLIEHVPEPQWLRFTNGRRRQLWNRNCVAVGAAGAHIEPLESTNLHLIHSGISRLIALFPYRNRTAAESAEYNRLMNAELECIRDLLILHYHATARDDSELWRRSSANSVPEALERKIRLFRSRGRIVLYDEECFPELSWLCVLTGQQVWPERVDLLADTTDLAKVCEQLARMRSEIRKSAEGLPDHGLVLGRYCAAERSSG